MPRGTGTNTRHGAILRQHWPCRCISCGKMVLSKHHSECPLCGCELVQAKVPDVELATEIASMDWKLVTAPALIESLREIGIRAVIPPLGVVQELDDIAKSRVDFDNNEHLVAHKFVKNRPGLAMADLKSKSGLKRALRRISASLKPTFSKWDPSLRHPSTMGKFIEAELSYRSRLRRPSSIALQSEQRRFSHPLVGVVNVETDGRMMGKSPAELKTVGNLASLDKRKLKEIAMQIGGQCLATGVAGGLLIVATRDGKKMTAVIIENAADFHMSNVRRWKEEIDIRFARKEQEVSSL